LDFDVGNPPQVPRESYFAWDFSFCKSAKEFAAKAVNFSSSFFLKILLK